MLWNRKRCCDLYSVDLHAVGLDTSLCCIFMGYIKGEGKATVTDSNS